MLLYTKKESKMVKTKDGISVPAYVAAAINSDPRGLTTTTDTYATRLERLKNLPGKRVGLIDAVK